MKIYFKKYSNDKKQALTLFIKNYLYRNICLRDMCIFKENCVIVNCDPICIDANTQ